MQNQHDPHSGQPTKTALFIGRFQPLHLGHLSVIQRALNENDHLYIAIGSTEQNFQPDNPFTIAERIMIIQMALDEIGADPTKFTIIPVPNINNFALWPHQVELYVPPFHRVYTGSTVVATLFEETNKTRKEPYEIYFIQKELQISSTEVRERLIKRRNWQKYVPLSTARLLAEWNAEQRLLSIQESKK